MNKNSIICQYLNDHQDNWRADMEKLNIKYKEDASGLCIFKYGIGADFSNPIVCEARGIIIDLNTLSVECIGFDKFFNSHEPYAATDKIDWSSAKVQEKLDGAICKLFWNHYTGKWQWATNGTLDAEAAECTDMFHDNYLELIKGADNYSAIRFDDLNHEYTFIFEIVDPLMHVVKYPAVHLYHIGTRHNHSLKECVCDIGIEHPKEYPLHSLDECVKYVETLNTDDNVEHEGFVVVDGNWNRIKVKNSTYLKMHYYANNGVLTKSRIMELLRTDDFDPEAFTKTYPQYGPVIAWYSDQVSAVREDIAEFIQSARRLYASCGNDRKIVASAIKDHKYAAFGFRSLGNDMTAEQLISQASPAQFERLIPDYSGKDASDG